MRRRLVALTVVPLLLLGACGGDDGTDTPGAAQSSGVDTGAPVEGVEVTGAFGEEPEVTIEDGLTVSETQAEVLEVGDGAEAGTEQGVLLHFAVYNGSNGEKVGATYEQEPLNASLAEGQLFTSFIDALEGKPSGSRVLILSTPEEAYGAEGAPQLKLKAEDPVVFVVDVLSTHPETVLDGPEGEPNADLPEELPAVVENDQGDVTDITFEDAPKKPSDELQVITLIEGDGPAARKASFVTFDYFGQIYGTDTVFDESYSGDPRTFPVGINGLIPAWDQSLAGVKRGTRLMIIAPPEFGYGEGGNAGAGIKGTDTLVFVHDVHGVD